MSALMAQMRTEEKAKSTNEKEFQSTPLLSLVRSDVSWLRFYRGTKLLFWKTDFTEATTALQGQIGQKPLKRQSDFYEMVECTGLEGLLEQESDSQLPEASEPYE